MQYMLLIYNCERPEPDDPGFDDAMARVNAFADECRRRGAFVAGHPLQPEHTATTVSVRDGKTLITDGPFVETHEHLGELAINPADRRFLARRMHDLDIKETR
jgi:hypothetical protein